MTPLVSILIPAYNGERYIAAALDCASAQTHANVEIIVGDDGSTDGTAAIVLAAAARDPRIRLIRHVHNLGAPANQVALHEAARGEFVKPLLQDDLIAPTAVERLLAPMRSDRAVALAFARRQLIDSDGAVLAHQWWTQALSQTDVVMDGWMLGSAMLERIANNVGEVTCVLYRRDAIDPVADMWQIGGHEFGPIGDFALWLKLLSRGDAFYTPEILASFRQHADQSSQRPEVALGGACEWCLAVLGARRLGYLSSARAEREALSAALERAAAALRHAAHDPVWSTRLRDVIALTLERLAAPELVPLADRYPVAVAAPAIEAGEISASVTRLRALAQDEVVQRCVIAVPADRIALATPHIERALSAGADFELELTPTDAPGTLIAGPWLAVLTATGDGADAWAQSASERVLAAQSR